MIFSRTLSISLSNKQYAELRQGFLDIVKEESLDKKIVEQFENIYLPLSEWVAQKHLLKPIVIGINGAQGTGKSTLSAILKFLIEKRYGKKVVHISIDDLYYGRRKRKELSESIHPLLQTRGVPGTHDVNMGVKILDALTNEHSNEEILIPVFDKASDDQISETQWRRVKGGADIVLFEGWCVASLAQEDNLQNDINQLERDEDEDGIWRNYVNQQLSGPYKELYKYIDYLIMLEAPDSESVYEWRLLQEKKLKASRMENGHPVDNLMSGEEMKRFIMHFERITKNTLEEMPGRADIVLKLNKDHQIYDVVMNE